MRLTMLQRRTLAILSLRSATPTEVTEALNAGRIEAGREEVLPSWVATALRRLEAGKLVAQTPAGAWAPTPAGLAAMRPPLLPAGSGGP